MLRVQFYSIGEGVGKVKQILIIISTLALAILIIGCPMNTSLFEEGDFEPGFSSDDFNLPDDIVKDTPRSRAAEFEFKTFFPVDVEIETALYGPGRDGQTGTVQLDSEAAQVHVELMDTSGNTVLEGLTGEDGKLSAQAFLPAAPEDINLLIEAEGFASRELVIEDMVNYEKITRIVSLEKTGSSTAVKNGSIDSDGDGVPDDQDINPWDENEAYEIRIPADGKLSVAFEDLFGVKDAGDADYNDFIAVYSVVETVNSTADKVSRIRFEITGREKIAGYRHLFGLRLNDFDGKATVEGEVSGLFGKRITYKKCCVSAPLEIPVFADTNYAVGETSVFTVIFNTPQNIDPKAAEVIVDRAPFNPYLFIYNTWHDIHLVGEETLTKSINPGATYMDANNFPWGLLVPTDWVSPEETKRIEDYYPDFTEWRINEGNLKQEWYLNYIDPNAPPVTNNPPYPVISPYTARTFAEDSGFQTFQLSIDEQNGLKDPDDDSVYFRFSPADTGWVSLDENTGVVTVDTVDSHAAQDFQFWSEDSEGADTKDEAVTVNLKVIFS